MNYQNHEQSRESCPVCRSIIKESTLFLDRNLDLAKIDGYSYSSRKKPEFMNHKLVRCAKCRLVYATSTPTEESLLDEYSKSLYNSKLEDEFAALTYFDALRSHRPYLLESNGGRALDLGSGAAVFLEQLLRSGFKELIGIEPSISAFTHNNLENQSDIRIDQKYDRDNFANNSLDLFSSFMTFEHILYPLEMMIEAYRVLKPGGIIALALHNIDSNVNKILGRLSPVIDIEHLQLFSKKSAYHMADQAGFAKINITNYANTYPIYYWIKLLPITPALAKQIYRILDKTPYAEKAISLPAGNFFLTAEKPNKLK